MKPVTFNVTEVCVCVCVCVWLKRWTASWSRIYLSQVSWWSMGTHLKAKWELKLHKKVKWLFHLGTKERVLSCTADVSRCWDSKIAADQARRPTNRAKGCETLIPVEFPSETIKSMSDFVTSLSDAGSFIIQRIFFFFCLYSRRIIRPAAGDCLNWIYYVFQFKYETSRKELDFDELLRALFINAERISVKYFTTAPC